jgi:uncharacterized protein YbbK (DUF523 family)
MKPRVGISSCLLGERVRYDGGHKRQAALIRALSRHVEWMPVCPEVEVGMEVPREPVRLVGDARRPRMIGEASGRDWPRRMRVYARRRAVQLRRAGLAGCILKSRSPSCGRRLVNVYSRGGTARRTGRGLFAQALVTAMPRLPIEQEDRLRDAPSRARFLRRLVDYHRRQMAGG